MIGWRTKVLALFLCFYMSTHAQKGWDPKNYSRFDAVTVQDQPFFKAIVDTASFIPELLNAAIFYETNRKRLLAQVPVLLYDARLERSAQKHSDDMVAQEYFSHSGVKEGQKTLEQRLKNVGLEDGYFGENIIQWPVLQINNLAFIPPSVGGYFKSTTGDSIEMHTYQSLAEEIVDGWMNSQGHRTNILSRSYSHLGVGSGLFFSGDSIDRVPGVKCTQNFARVVHGLNSPSPRRALSLPPADNASPAEMNDRMERTNRNREKTTKESSAEFEYGYELIAVKKNAKIKDAPLPFELDRKKSKRNRERNINTSTYLPFAVGKGEIGKMNPHGKDLPDNTPFAGEKKILVEIHGFHEPVDYLAFAFTNSYDENSRSFKPARQEMPFVLVRNETSNPNPVRKIKNNTPFSRQNLSSAQATRKPAEDLPFEYKGLKKWFVHLKRNSGSSK